jgi:hypothetical protein
MKMTMRKRLWVCAIIMASTLVLWVVTQGVCTVWPESLDWYHSFSKDVQSILFFVANLFTLVGLIFLEGYVLKREIFFNRPPTN